MRLRLVAPERLTSRRRSCDPHSARPAQQERVPVELVVQF